MAIDARIVGVTAKPDGTIRLNLEARNKKSIAGQSVLTIHNSSLVETQKLNDMIGKEIWGDSSWILVGDRKWARRIGYTEIELL